MSLSFSFVHVETIKKTWEYVTQLTRVERVTIFFASIISYIGWPNLPFMYNNFYLHLCFVPCRCVHFDQSLFHDKQVLAWTLIVFINVFLHFLFNYILGLISNFEVVFKCFSFVSYYLSFFKVKVKSQTCLQ